MKRLVPKCIVLFLGLGMVAGAQAPGDRGGRQRGTERFLREAPKVGEALPDLTLYDSGGGEVHLGSMRGHFTVLTFGCLT